jgi:hypothetical protein
LNFRNGRSHGGDDFGTDHGHGHAMRLRGIRCEWVIAEC